MNDDQSEGKLQETLGDAKEEAGDLKEKAVDALEDGTEKVGGLQDRPEDDFASSGDAARGEQANRD